MKYLTFLFAIYLSVLTLAPAILQSFPCMKLDAEKTMLHNCCKHKDECNNKGGKSNCPFGICCNNCLFFHKASETISFISPVAKKELIISKNENLTSSYIADCWHPPENLL